MENMQPVMMIVVEKEDRTFRFEMPIGAPLGECYDAAFSILRQIVELADKAAATNKKEEEEVVADHE